MSRVPNQMLADLMAEAEASNKGLAKRMRDIAAQRGTHLGTTHQSIQRWLDGGGITSDAVGFLADALSAAIGRPIAVTDLGFPPHRHRDEWDQYPGSLPDVLAALGRLTQSKLSEAGEDDPGLLPEDVVQQAAFTWLVARPDGLPEGAGRSRVGMRDVSAIRTAAEMFMRLDFLHGGGHGHRALRHYFQQEVIPLLRSSYSTRVGEALFAASCEISQLLAWTAYDGGHHALANRYLIGTLRLTQVTDDRVMGARILSNMSHQANYLGEHARAVQLARASIEGGRGRATPRAMTLFTAHEARALAVGGESRRAAMAMSEAERIFDRVTPGDDDPGWLSYMDQAELIGELCHCWRDLGEAARAVTLAEQALRLTDPQYARTLGFLRMVLAQSQMLNGELDTALATARQAVADVDSLQSVRFQRYVADFMLAISPHQADTSVRQFKEEVHAAMTQGEDL